MPSMPLKPCAKPGCGCLSRSAYCDRHFKPPAWRLPDDRPSAAARGYGWRWQRAREGYLAKHPWCAACAKRGRQELATLVDHVIPHKGEKALFWDSDNWQSLCHGCHSSKTAKERG